MTCQHLSISRFYPRNGLRIQTDLGGLKLAKDGSLSVFAGYTRIDPRVLNTMVGVEQSHPHGPGRDHVFSQWWLNILYALPKSKAGN